MYDSSGSSYIRLKQYLQSQQRQILLLFLFVAVLFRLLYFLQLNQTPLVELHRWDETDMNFFDLWAKEITHGDWLVDKALYPQHLWHRQLAEKFVQKYPEQFPDIQASRPSKPLSPEIVKQIWSRWYGEKYFYQSPLYPYFIAITYTLFQEDPRFVFFGQAICGVATVLLVYGIAFLIFDPVIAFVAGLLALFCGPLMFYEMVLLRDSTITFMTLLLIYSFLKTSSKNRTGSWFLFGILFGAAILLKDTFTFFYGLLFLLLFYSHRNEKKKFFKLLFPLLGGTFLCLLPLMARNIAVGVSPFKLSSGNGAITFIQSNAEDYDPQKGMYTSIHTLDILEKTQGKFFPTLWETWRTHVSIWSYLKQLGRKFDSLWYWYEKPNNTNFYYYREHLPVLQYLPLTFWILGPLAFIGIFLSLSNRLRVGILYLFILGFHILFLFSLVLSRFRVPLLAILIPFAALCLVRLSQFFLQKEYRKVFFLGIAFVILACWMMRPLRADPIRYSDYAMPYTFYYFPLAQEAITEKNWEYLYLILRESLQYEPPLIRKLNRLRPVENELEEQVARLFLEIYPYYILALKQTSQLQEATYYESRLANLKQAIQKN